jgi:NitT/TauT family transport system substrate-binding protein
MYSLIFALAFQHQALALEKTSIALNWKPEPEFGGFYAAETSGAYKKHGLEVALLPGGSGTPVIQMIAAGKVDFGINSADEVLMARSYGQPVVALFAVYQTNPQCVMAHPERGFKNLADVFKSDGTLAIERGLPYTQYLLNKFGAKPKVNMVPYTGGVATFLRDKNFSQQCFAASEPLEAKKKAKVQVFLVAEEGFNPYTAVLTTREDVIKKNPKLVKEVVEAVREGWREYLDHPDAANKLMAGLNKAMDPATFKESAEAQKPLVETAETKKIGLGKMTQLRWDQLARQLVELKVIEKKPEGTPFVP